MYKDMMPADIVHQSGRPHAPVGIARPVDNSTLEQQVFEQQERLTRLLADFDTFKQRASRETGQRALAEKEALVRDLLPAIDNLDRALGDSSSAESVAGLRQGAELALNELVAVLQKHGFEQRALGGRESASLAARRPS